MKYDPVSRRDSDLIAVVTVQLMILWFLTKIQMEMCTIIYTNYTWENASKSGFLCMSANPTVRQTIIINNITI
jgi:hypothetical protein